LGSILQLGERKSRNLLHFPSYGDRQSAHGWEIDHHPIPQALGGSDDIDNLRPLHCRSNAALGGLRGLALGGGTKQ
jgi:hypothetical protein